MTFFRKLVYLKVLIIFLYPIFRKYLKEGTNFMEETEAMKKTKRFRPMPYEERVLTLFDEQLRTLP